MRPRTTPSEEGRPVRYRFILNQANAPSANPFRRGHLRRIGRIQRYHAVGGANGTTMVVMFVG
jgi:hypothetical protein